MAMNRCLAINQEWRVVVAHASLDIDADGNRKLRQLKIQDGELKISETTKTAKDLQDGAGQLDKLAMRVRDLRTELSTLVFHLEAGTFIAGPPEFGSATLRITEQ